MKRLTVLCLMAMTLLLNSCATYVNSLARYEKGYWGEWDSSESRYWTFQGSPEDFIVYATGVHPSSYYFRVKIFGFSLPELKKNKEITYSGTIEYQDRTVVWKGIGKYDYKKQSLEFVRDPLGWGNNDYTKRAAKITAFYKKGGTIVYNIWFDDVGLGLTIPW